MFLHFHFLTEAPDSPKRKLSKRKKEKRQRKNKGKTLPFLHVECSRAEAQFVIGVLSLEKLGNGGSWEAAMKEGESGGGRQRGDTFVCGVSTC